VFGAVDDAERRGTLEAAGAEVRVLANPRGKVDLGAMLGELGRRGVNELHVEGGSRLNGSLAAEGWVDEYLIYVAPSFLGDGAQPMLMLPALADLNRRMRLRMVQVERIGEDLRLLARPVAQPGG
jgi:diaminohydroxyphosphoribosylaminopyrimidine deaminase / 5-amino-6-(5-phosphoribosylamino)uracil reductase